MIHNYLACSMILWKLYRHASTMNGIPIINHINWLTYLALARIRLKDDFHHQVEQQHSLHSFYALTMIKMCIEHWLMKILSIISIKIPFSYSISISLSFSLLFSLSSFATCVYFFMSFYPWFQFFSAHSSGSHILFRFSFHRILFFSFLSAFISIQFKFHHHHHTWISTVFAMHLCSA